MQLSRYSFATALFSVAILTTGCADSTGLDIGAIRATVSTTGAMTDRDPDGYTLSIDGGSSQSVDVNGTATFDHIRWGTHTVQLGGLATNCSVPGLNPVSVDIHGPQPAAVQFTVLCDTNTGTIQVSVATSGPDVDPDGYTVNLIGVASLAIPTNGILDFYNIRTGDVAVELSGVAGNCVVDGANPRTVTIPFAKTGEVAFTVNCTPAGSLLVTTTTAGAYPDPNGYQLEIQQGNDSATRTSLPANGTVTVPGLLGTYALSLVDMMPNCDATPNPRTVAVTVGSGTPIAVNVTCGAPRDLAFVRVDGANADVYLIASNGMGERRISTSPVSDVDPAWSPDGTRIAFTSERDGNREIYVMNPDGSNLMRLTNSPAPDDRPAWSPDGTRIAFVSARDGSADIYVMNADGTNPVRLTNNAAYDADPAWSPDGSRIAFSSDRDGNAGSSSIWVMNADGSAPVRLTTGPYGRGDSQPAWSPDGTRIAFSRKSPNSSDIYAVKPDGTGVIQITYGIDNASDPAWSPDGRQIALGSEKATCGWYDYDCGPLIVVVGADGGQYYSLQIEGASPAWRP